MYAARRFLMGLMLAVALVQSVGTPVAAGSVAAAGPNAYPWRQVIETLRAQRRGIASNLEAARSVLLSRARVEDPRLVGELDFTPPAKPGYRIVPKVRENSPAASISPTERVYSLKHLSAAVRRADTAASLLSRRADAASSPLLEPLVDEFGRLRRQLDLFARHISYHAHWQRTVAENAEYFAGRNRIVALVRGLHGPGARNASPGLPDAVKRRIEAFKRTPGLVLAVRRDGTRELPVTIVTDIADEAFLARFRDGVEAAFVDSAPARAGRFRVALSIRGVPLQTLYPEGAPARGSTVDMRDHLGRFPPGSLVLTTGGASTHAWSGRAIILGPMPLSPRVLAHEFGHLLGFGDSYLRGYDGDPKDRYGAVLVEWHGLIDDLMGNSRAGRMSGRLIETLIAKYGRRRVR